MEKDGALTWTEQLESTNIPHSAAGETNLQKVVNLLEQQGFHVFKAEEKLIQSGIAPGRPTRAIFLRITPKSVKKNV